MNYFSLILALVCISGIMIVLLVKQIVWGLVSALILAVLILITHNMKKDVEK